jgi:hypothetical protein
VETKAPRDNYRGTGRFTTSEERFGGSSYQRNFELYCLTAWRTNVGVFFPRHRCDRASDTPVATFVLPTVASPSRGSSEKPKTA